MRARVGVLEQSPAEGAGSEGLAGAGGHLDQRAGLILGKRGLQAGDGVDLAVAQAGSVQRRQVLEPAAQGVGFLQPAVQRLRLVEGEDAARAWLWVARIAEVSLLAGGLVVEDERVGPAREMAGEIDHVLVSLLRDTAQGNARLLGFNDASRLAAYK